MVVMVFGNVVLRYVFNSGITASEELARFFFLWLIFVGSVVVIAERGHLGVDTVISRLPRSGKIAFVLISNALMLWVCYLFFVGSWRQTVVGWGNAQAGHGHPHGLPLRHRPGHERRRRPRHPARHLVVRTGKATDAELIQIVESEDVESHEGGNAAADPDSRAEAGPHQTTNTDRELSPW